MAAIFKRRANALSRLALFALATAPVAVIVALVFYARSPIPTEMLMPFRQPIEFDHRHHAGDDGIDCVYCHSTVETSDQAGVPSTYKCMGCHSQIWNQSPILAPLRERFFDGKPVEWVKVDRLPDYVYFDHSIHVSKGVGCLTCHGRVDLMPATSRSEKLTMKWCIDCHRDPGPHLRPLDQITSMTWTPPDDRLGPKLAREYDVRPGLNCYTCHR